MQLVECSLRTRSQDEHVLTQLFYMYGERSEPCYKREKYNENVMVYESPVVSLVIIVEF